MVTLAEIESAAADLSPAEKQELMLFLATRLRAEGATLPEPRTFTRNEMAGWTEEDEADMRRLSCWGNYHVAANQQSTYRGR